MPKPDPWPIAERYAQVSGDPQMSPLLQYGLPVPEGWVEYGIDPDALDVAKIALRVPDIDPDGMPAVRRRNVPIGRYDPARDLWVFDQEYVTESERADLT